MLSVYYFFISDYLLQSQLLEQSSREELADRGKDKNLSISQASIQRSRD